MIRARILNISIFDVISDHSLCNSDIFNETGIKPLGTYVELRRARWLEKIANMSEKRNPRKLIGAWLPYARRNGTSGRPQQTIRHAYVQTLITLGFTKDCTFETWMKEAKDRIKWAKRVEHYLDLPKGSYSRANAKHQAAQLRDYSNL